MRKHKLVLSSTPGGDHVIERTDDTSPEVRPGTLVTQGTLEKLERTNRYEITLTRRKD